MPNLYSKGIYTIFIFLSLMKFSNIDVTKFLVLFGLTLSLAATPSFQTFDFANAQEIESAEDNRPNILVIMADDFGFSDLGVFGSEISTPNIDALAKDGKILTNYYTHPVCSPARSTFLTGVDNHIAGIGTMFENMAPNQVNKTNYETYITDRVVTVAELVKDSGYDTLLSGKWHLSGKGFQNGYWTSR